MSFHHRPSSLGASRGVLLGKAALMQGPVGVGRGRPGFHNCQISATSAFLLPHNLMVTEMIDKEGTNAMAWIVNWVLVCMMFAGLVVVGRGQDDARKEADAAFAEARDVRADTLRRIETIEAVLADSPDRAIFDE